MNNNQLAGHERSGGGPRTVSQTTEAAAAQAPGDEPRDEAATEATPLHVDVEVNRLKVPSVVLATIGVLGVLFLAYVVYRTLSLLMLLFIALLVATAIEPVVNWLRRGPFNRSAGILVVYSGLFLFIFLLGYLLLPIIFQQVGELGNSLPKSVQQMRDSVKEVQNPFVRQQGLTMVNVLDTVVRQFQTTSVAQNDPNAANPKTVDPKTVEDTTQTALLIAEVVLGFITIFVVAFYWLTERTRVKRALMTWFPPRRANRIRRVWDDIEVKVGGWVRGQLTLMLIVGSISAVGYFVMGIQYWPALALFIGIAEAIPLVGPYLGTAPAVLVALTQPDGGAGKALLVIGFAVVLQTIEGNVLLPRIMKNSVGISPLAVIVSILFGGTLAGLAGALVAVPIAGSLQVILSDLKAAHESDAKLVEETEAAAETRAKDGELVVATG